MGHRFNILLTILFILFSGFVRATDWTQEQPSISKTCALIKKYIDSREPFNVTIVNSHNGRYTITSSIWAGADSVRLLTHVIDMTGGKRDTTINLDKKDFLFKLSKASSPINSTKLAGHYQRISVNRKGIEDTFETVDGRTLMDLLEYGE
ncbi:MAG: hypothetical protein DI539_23650 [Flavobacterium psychrophilum]|jgi:hypothetical protein|nr:MAG: hypothetical protein DI539_23650 [Flavobacterium psychrophilum]